MHRLFSIYPSLFLLLLFAIGLSSCTDSITDIANNPAKYDGKVVTVTGEVSTSTNLLLLKVYTITDGKSEVYVRTRLSVPKEGDIVTVTGKVSQLVKIFDEQVVGIEEEERTIR